MPVYYHMEECIQELQQMMKRNEELINQMNRDIHFILLEIGQTFESVDQHETAHSEFINEYRSA